MHVGLQSIFSSSLPYQPPLSGFNSTDRLARGADLTSIADGTQFTVAFVVKGIQTKSGGPTDYTYLIGGPDSISFTLAIDNLGYPYVVARSSAGANLVVASSTIRVDDQKTHMIAISANVATGNLWFEVDNVNALAGGYTLVNGTIDFTRGNFYVSSYAASMYFIDGSVGPVFFDTRYLASSDARKLWNDGPVPYEAPHRYWRYYKQNANVYGNYCWEMELYDEYGVQIPLTAGMISTSGVTLGGAGFGVDGNTGGSPFFSADSAGIGSFIKFDLGAGNERAVTKWRSYVNGITYSGDVQYSDDNSSWTTVATGYDISGASGWKEIEFKGYGIMNARPALYLPNAYTTKGTNHGYGGNLTLTGTLTDGGYIA